MSIQTSLNGKVLTSSLFNEIFSNQEAKVEDLLLA